MEHSQSQITDHSSERIEIEPDISRPDWEDNLTCIIEAKDEMIETQRKRIWELNDSITEQKRQIDKIDEYFRRLEKRLLAIQGLCEGEAERNMNHDQRHGIRIAIAELTAKSLSEVYQAGLSPKAAPTILYNEF
jgi:uncharacterized coiled-coil protein SlyX